MILKVLETNLKFGTHFESTYARIPDGRFEVRLPMKRDISLLANTLKPILH